MKIVVFGATGGVGRSFVDQAREAGHDVTVFVRNPDKLERHDVNVIVGDAFDRDSVSQAIVEQDAVVSALGSSTGMKRSNELERMAENIATGMSEAGVNRIVYCASAGIHGELQGVAGKAVMWLLRNPLRDHVAAVAKLQGAGLRLTVARPMSLTQETGIHAYAEDRESVATKHGISRPSVAQFMLKALGDDTTYVGASVGLSGDVSAGS